jgi:hypothetical protein
MTRGTERKSHYKSLLSLAEGIEKKKPSKRENFQTILALLEHIQQIKSCDLTPNLTKKVKMGVRLLSSSG